MHPCSHTCNSLQSAVAPMRRSNLDSSAFLHVTVLPSQPQEGILLHASAMSEQPDNLAPSTGICAHAILGINTGMPTAVNYETRSLARDTEG